MVATLTTLSQTDRLAVQAYLRDLGIKFSVNLVKLRKAHALGDLDDFHAYASLSRDLYVMMCRARAALESGIVAM